MVAQKWPNKLGLCQEYCGFEEMDRVKTLDTGHNLKLSNQSSAEESLKALGELSRAQYFYRKLHEKINHGTVFDGVANMQVMKTHWTL